MPAPAPAPDSPTADYQAFVQLLVSPEARLRSFLRALLPEWSDEWHAPRRRLVFDAIERGNGGLPTANHRFPSRRPYGSLDEFALYAAALSAEEIRAM